MYMKLKHVLISSVSLIQGCSLRGPGFTNKGSTHRTLPDTLLKCQVTAISKKACNIIISCTTSYQCSHQSILYEAITFICLLKIKRNVHSLHCNALQCILQCTMFKTRAEDMTIWNISSQLEKKDMLDVTYICVRQTKEVGKRSSQLEIRGPGFDSQQPPAYHIRLIHLQHQMCPRYRCQAIRQRLALLHLSIKHNIHTT